MVSGYISVLSYLSIGVWRLADSGEVEGRHRAHKEPACGAGILPAGGRDARPETFFPQPSIEFGRHGNVAAGRLRAGPANSDRATREFLQEWARRSFPITTGHMMTRAHPRRRPAFKARVAPAAFKGETTRPPTETNGGFQEALSLP